MTRIIEDGSVVSLSELLSSDVRDANGHRLNFHQINPNSNSYIAQAALNDGTDRILEGRFEVPQPTVTVSLRIVQQPQPQPQQAQAKRAK